jgi:hypothetical protein
MARNVDVAESRFTVIILIPLIGPVALLVAVVALVGQVAEP